MHVHVLRSPIGGGRRSRNRGQQLIEALRAAGHEVTDLTGASAAHSAARLRAVVAAEPTAERVLVSGGDGLVHLAVQELASSDVPVAIDPSGTGNDFAHALGLGPATPASVTASTAPVDLVRATATDGSATWVASIAIAGFPASINERANRLRLPLGSQIYTVAAALELPRFRRLDVEVRIDGVGHTLDSAILAIGNTRLFGGGMAACPDARPTDGLLHLTSIDGVGRLGILRHLAGRAGGTADRPEVLRRTASRIDIDTPGITIWGDGEPVGTSPMTLEIVPRALLVAGFEAA